MQRLNNKTCVVTGAARGIGRAIAARFHDEGAVVILTDIDEALGAATAADIGCRFEPLDVREEEDWSRLAGIVPVADVVVNNAGVTGFEAGMAPHDPEHASLADWREVHRVNLDGTFLGCRYAIGAMKAAGAGSIINISSRSGLVGIPGAAAYASSKAAIRNHSKTVALYCAQQGWKIRCNSIHPAAILTPIWEPMLGTGPDRDARMQALVADTPLKRFGMPDEVAAIVVMLASDEATYVTGTEVNIDGGLLAGSAASPGWLRWRAWSIGLANLSRNRGCTEGRAREARCSRPRCGFFREQAGMARRHRQARHRRAMSYAVIVIYKTPMHMIGHLRPGFPNLRQYHCLNIRRMGRAGIESQMCGISHYIKKILSKITNVDTLRRNAPQVSTSSTFAAPLTAAAVRATTVERGGV